MMKLVDITDLKSVEHYVRVGSSPIQGTMDINIDIVVKELLRLDSLRRKGKLNKNSWQQFFLYKDIVYRNIDLVEDEKAIFISTFNRSE